MYAQWPLISIIFLILSGITFVTGIVLYILGLRRKKDNHSNPFLDSIMLSILIALLFAFIALGFALSLQHGQMLGKFDEVSGSLDEIRDLLLEIRDLLR